MFFEPVYLSGVMLHVSEEHYIDATYGQEVTLPCQVGVVNPSAPVIWKYKSEEIIKYQRGHLLRGKNPVVPFIMRLKEGRQNLCSLMKSFNSL